MDGYKEIASIMGLVSLAVQIRRQSFSRSAACVCCRGAKDTWVQTVGVEPEFICWAVQSPGTLDPLRFRTVDPDKAQLVIAMQPVLGNQ
jgi:hypothetical protein